MRASTRKWFSNELLPILAGTTIAGLLWYLTFGRSEDASANLFLICLTGSLGGMVIASLVRHRRRRRRGL